jgi:hypothetical protein
VHNWNRTHNTDRFRLPQDWSRGYLRAIARTPETDSTDGEAKRRRLEQARDNLKSLFIWSDIGEAQYRRQREEIDRQIAAVAPPKSPAILTDARRAATLLQDIGALWSHPGVAPERQKEFIDEVFQEIQFDQHGIRVVLPRTEYRALVALTEASRGGNGRGDWIRTSDLLNPIQVRYQAALRPDRIRYYHRASNPLKGPLWQSLTPTADRLTPKRSV